MQEEQKRGADRTMDRIAFAVIAITILAGVIGGGYFGYRISVWFDGPTAISTNTDVAVTAGVGEKTKAKSGKELVETLSPKPDTRATQERWRDTSYVPNDSDYNAAARRASGGNIQKEQDMKAALCAFYQNCH
jgi:hypothetical protein